MRVIVFNGILCYFMFLIQQPVVFPKTLEMKKSTKPTNRQEQEESSFGNIVKSTEFDILGDNKKKTFLNIFDHIFLTILFLILLTNLLSSFEIISWQLSSFGRIILIKTLAYYDWRPLKNEQCLVKRFFSEKQFTLDSLNCNLCEDIFEVDVHRYLEEDILEERYINIDIPVILTKDVEKWPNDSNFIEDIKKDVSFTKSYPCSLATNIFKGVADIGTILSKQKYFDRFFIHFQNCDIEAMRTLRKYVYRPDALPPTYSPTLYNWLIWNKNYNTTNFKRVELVEKVTVVGQLFGSTYFRLIPRKHCENVCPSLSFSLDGGELLFFTSLWDLEYRPNENGENMAVIIEY